MKLATLIFAAVSLSTAPALAATLSFAPDVGGNTSGFWNIGASAMCMGERVGPIEGDGGPDTDGGYFIFHGQGDEVQDVRLNFEFGLTPSAIANARSAKLSFDLVDIEFTRFGEVCLIGYRGDGTIDASDFQAPTQDLLDEVQVGLPQGAPVNYQVDVTAFLKEFGTGGAPRWLGFQFTNQVDEGFTIGNVRLIVETVPEPAAYGLLALGVLGLAAMRRRTV